MNDTQTVILGAQYGDEGKGDNDLSPKQLKVWNYLSTVGEAGPSEIVRATSIALGTVRQALERLVELGQVKRLGRGRGTRYVKIKDQVRPQPRSPRGLT